MTKKTATILLSAAILTTIATTRSFALESKKIDTEEIERFFYQKGYNDAKNKFYVKGYRDGIEFAKKKLAEYRAKIEALERGKYLIKNKKITYPEVYQTTDSKGNIKVVIGGCKIERPLSPSDIVKLPVIDPKVCADIGYARSPRDVHYVDENGPRLEAPSIDNDVFLEEREGLNLPKKTSDEVSLTYKYFPNKDFYKRLLEKSGILYSIFEDKIKAVFDSEEDARRFCRLYRLRVGKDCL